MGTPPVSEWLNATGVADAVDTVDTVDAVDAVALARPIEVHEYRVSYCVSVGVALRHEFESSAQVQNVQRQLHRVSRLVGAGRPADNVG
jgi:hypothetical protein